MHTTDLTTRPPRSPRVRIGGYVLLARMLDKGRAEIAGKANGYHFGCPLDARWLEFTGCRAEDIRALLEKGAGDGEVLAWVRAHAPLRRSPVEIEQWSRWQEERVPGDLETRDFLQKLHREAGAERDDIRTFFDGLDLDDHVSYGGKP